MKEASRRQFVGASTNLDLWGVVYSVCSGKNVKDCLTSLTVKKVEYVTWKECSSLMIGRFLPATTVRRVIL